MRGNRQLSSSLSNFVRKSRNPGSQQQVSHQIVICSSSPDNFSRSCTVRQTRNISNYECQYRTLKHPYTYTTSASKKSTYLISPLSFLSTTTDGGEGRHDDILGTINAEKNSKDAIAVQGEEISANDGNDKDTEDNTVDMNKSKEGSSSSTSK